MRFYGYMWPSHMPTVYCHGSLFKLEERKGCHKFSLCPESEISGHRRFKLFPGELIKYESLHGPATKMDKTIVYPCENNKCQIPCPCHLCRFKKTYCHTKHSKTVTVCNGCFEDCDDHLSHHKVYHINCTYCDKMYQLFPFLHETVWKYEGLAPGHYKVYQASFVFEHLYLCGQQTVKFSSSTCEYCNKGFSSKAKMKIHIKSVHFKDTYRCSQCEMNFSRKDNFERHRKIHSKDSDISDNEHKIVKQKCDDSGFICKKCGIKFKAKSHLNRHEENSKTEDGIYKNICNICGTDFCIQRELFKHQSSEHKELLKCDICLKTFTRSLSYSIHRANRKELLCEQCGQLICTENDFRMHINSVHNISKCPYCGIIYGLDNIKWHMYAEHQKLF